MCTDCLGSFHSAPWSSRLFLISLYPSTYKAGHILGWLADLAQCSFIFLLWPPGLSWPLSCLHSLVLASLNSSGCPPVTLAPTPLVTPSKWAGTTIRLALASEGIGNFIDAPVDTSRTQRLRTPPPCSPLFLHVYIVYVIFCHLLTSIYWWTILV